MRDETVRNGVRRWWGPKWYREREENRRTEETDDTDQVRKNGMSVY